MRNAADSTEAAQISNSFLAASDSVASDSVAPWLMETCGHAGSDPAQLNRGLSNKHKTMRFPRHSVPCIPQLDMKTRNLDVSRIIKHGRSAKCDHCLSHTIGQSVFLKFAS